MQVPVAHDRVATVSAASARREPLTTARIVQAALTIADAEGLEALTMRRLALELGAAPMAAYAHFADKRELLAEIVDAVMGEVELPEADGRWRKPLRRVALSFRQVLLAHPAVMPAFHACGARGPNALAVIDRGHGILRRAGLPDEHVVRAVDTFYAFALGAVSLEIAWASVVRPVATPRSSGSPGARIPISPPSCRTSSPATARIASATGSTGSWTGSPQRGAR